MCPVCPAHSCQEDRIPIGEMPLTTYPMKIVGADLIGPSVMSPEIIAVLTIIDNFTGWAEAIPLKDKKNASTWHAFTSCFFPSHGLPC